MEGYICIHGHFYQPPRENPWLEEVELQDSAHPFHDWNERITAECYAPNAASRILDTEGRIAEIVNNYSRISFNFGPTLLSWLERHHTHAYAKILAADAESRERFSGHGSALAQPYNHMIMPLANRRDKETQIIWGIRDFTHRFQRHPEGMWLPEAAVDLETLDILADHDIRFTVLSPQQAKRVRPGGSDEWQDVGDSRIDPKAPYFCTLPSGRKLALFFYDGPISREIAFGDLLNDGVGFATRLLKAFDETAESDQLMHIATDGETYGHHHANGDMALAYCLRHIESNNLARLTIYGEYLEKHPPAHEVEIFENSSWSCVHGIERWRGDCGCCTGGNPGWNQAWRQPLREALDWLRDQLSTIYEKELRARLDDPWQMRSDYIDLLLDRRPETLEAFFTRRKLDYADEKLRVSLLKLLEMQRYAMYMFTSCGWFFDEISGIETVQDLRYAARAMQLAGEITGRSLEKPFLKLMEKALSNADRYDNGRDAYDDLVSPMALDLLRVGAHYAVSSLFRSYKKELKLFCYSVEALQYEQLESGYQKMALGRIRIVSGITQESAVVSFAVLHLGEHNFIGGGKLCAKDQCWTSAQEVIKNAFLKGDISGVISLIDSHYDSHDFGLWHLFRDEQRSVMAHILDKTLNNIGDHLNRVYSDYYPLMLAMRNLAIPLPDILSTTLGFVLNQQLTQVFDGETLDQKELEKILLEVRRWSAQIDTSSLTSLAAWRIRDLMTHMENSPDLTSLAPLREATDLFASLEGLHLNLDVWQAQNIYFTLMSSLLPDMRGKTHQGNTRAGEWVDRFLRLGEYLRIGVE